jgi:hypothetical protein
MFFEASSESFFLYEVRLAIEGTRQRAAATSRSSSSPWLHPRLAENDHGSDCER